jgi:low temperature requirement protein LtrA
MRLPGSPVQQDQDAVSPLELFFDLVFIFAVSQLSHHLLNPVSWRGAAEILVLLIAVFGVWSGTSFEATLLNLGRSHAQAMLLAVMLVGLFMNAAIAHAFDTGGWAFVVPLLVIQGGRSILMIVGAPTRKLREHYARLLCWILATAPLWITGAVVQAEVRLLWWAGAAVIDLAGTWLAHPVPGRALHSENVEFDADHMIERCPAVPAHRPGRIGPDLWHRPRRCSQNPIDAGDRHRCPGHHRRAVGAALRRLGSPPGPVCADHHRSDPRRSKDGEWPAGLSGRTDRGGGGQRTGHRPPHGQTSVTLSLLLFGGPLLYQLSQTVYLRVVVGRRSLPRLAGIAVLVLAGGVSHLLPPYGALGLVATLLLVLVVIVVRERDATASRLLTRRQA